MTYNFDGIEFDVTYEKLRVNGVEISDLPLMVAIAKLMSIPDESVSSIGNRYYAYYNAIDEFLNAVLIGSENE